jgi:hypothetical protein
VNFRKSIKREEGEVTAKFLVMPSKATRTIVVASHDITACVRAPAGACLAS